MIDEGPASSNGRPRQVFVLGTGRSGTTTVARFLSAVPGCRVVHELEPILLRETIAYLTGAMSHDEMVDLLRRTRSPEVIGGERLSGESNQRLSFLLPALAEAFPSARYIWLIRDGREAVTSIRRRKWYHRREAEVRHPDMIEWASTRVQGDQVGEMPAEQWAELAPFSRICWYWSYTNRLIPRQAATLNLSLLQVRLEDLATAADGVKAFCGLPDAATPPVPIANMTPAHKRRSSDDWTRGERREFERLAGVVMDEHYPDWREYLKLGLARESRILTHRAWRTLRHPLRSRRRV